MKDDRPACDISLFSVLIFDTRRTAPYRTPPHPTARFLPVLFLPLVVRIDVGSGRSATARTRRAVGNGDSKLVQLPVWLVPVLVPPGCSVWMQ